MAILNTFDNLSKDMYKDVDEHYRSSDKTMLALIVIHWLVGTFLFSTTYDTYLLGFGVSSFILAINIYSFLNFRGKSINRIIVAVSLLSFSSLFIQQQFGRIEFHFHVFIALSFLMIYKDLKPVIAGALFTLFHHTLFFLLQIDNVTLFGEPIIIFSYGCGWDILILHAYFVLFELSVLLYILNKQISQFTEYIRAKYEIQKINMNLEHTIAKRTEELIKAKEQAEESGRLKEEFLANMSHEIRTPMNAVLGFTDLLYEEIKEPKLIGYVKSIKSSGKQLLQIINDILEISKVQAGKMNITLSPVNPYTLLKDLHSIFKVKIDEKNIEFIFDIDKNLPKSLLLDEVRIRQILFNLLGNAVKFTNNGFIKVTATKHYQDEDKSMLDFIIKIQDSGIGIAEKEKDSIFNPFMQQEGQSAKEFGGTGLGLSISKKLANLMGGDIVLESKVGEGSTFILKINNVSVSSAMAEDTDIYEHEKLKSYKFEHANILLVDDIETNRTLVKNYLANYDFEITEADNGADALRLSSKGFDLILMDIKMPIMDGYEATKKIKASSLTSKIPVFALTASVLHNDATKEKNSVFDNFLCKPIDKKGLLEAMATVLPCHIDEVQTVENIKNDEDNQEETEVVLDEESIAFVNEKIIPELRNCKNSGDIDNIHDFANILNEFAEKNSITALSKKAQKLYVYIEAFDIENVLLILEDVCVDLKNLVS